MWLHIHTDTYIYAWNGSDEMDKSIPYIDHQLAYKVHMFIAQLWMP